jgi:hypothetical protein
MTSTNLYPYPLPLSREGGVRKRGGNAPLLILIPLSEQYVKGFPSVTRSERGTKGVR